MWIENVAMYDIMNGFHYDTGPNSLLIQIVDPDMEWPTPKHEFTKTLRLKFLDIEDVPNTQGPQHGHAVQILNALEEAKANKRNVIVHCVAGICRSGAVAEMGVVMGFQDTEKYRNPNLLLKKYLMEEYERRLPRSCVLCDQGMEHGDCDLG